MTLHLVRMGGLVTLIVLCTFYPFLPGVYDGLAVSLSAMAQMFGIVGLLLVPMGVLWLAYELRKRERSKRSLPTRARGYHLALASMVASSIVALILSLGAFMGISLSLGFLTLALWLYIFSRLTPGLKLMKKVEAEDFNPVPLYLVFVPSVILIFQIMLAAPAKQFSRNRAIAQSAELIADIEKYRARTDVIQVFCRLLTKTTIRQLSASSNFITRLTGMHTICSLSSLHSCSISVSERS